MAPHGYNKPSSPSYASRPSLSILLPLCFHLLVRPSNSWSQCNPPFTIAPYPRHQISGPMVTNTIFHALGDGQLGCNLLSLDFPHQPQQYLHPHKCLFCYHLCTSDLTSPGNTMLGLFLCYLGADTTQPHGHISTALAVWSTQSQLIQNNTFKKALFGLLKHWLVNVKGAKSCTLHDKIAKGDMPALLPAKTGGPMCFMHINGICNPDCASAANHMQYLAAKYCPLTEWFQQNYPKENWLIGRGQPQLSLLKTINKTLHSHPVPCWHHFCHHSHILRLTQAVTTQYSLHTTF